MSFIYKLYKSVLKKFSYFLEKIIKLMNYNQKFIEDLSAGNLGEKVFANFLLKKGFNIKGFNNDYKYDIITDYHSKIITFEIKTDRYEFLKSVKTNNIFIEVSCNNKPSGISKTEADIFVYFLPDYEECYCISVKELRKILRSNPEYFRYTTQSGDLGKVKGYLIN